MVAHGFKHCTPIIATDSLRERFWSKVSVIQDAGSCWVWTGAIGHTSGRGVMKIDGRPVLASRVSYVLNNGPLLPGQVVRHTCDNILCVRPSHLISGTQQQNSADMHERGRAGTLRGELSPNAKLTAADIPEIWDMHAAAVGIHEIGARKGVTFMTIRHVLLGNSWKQFYPTPLPCAGRCKWKAHKASADPLDSFPLVVLA